MPMAHIPEIVAMVSATIATAHGRRSGLLSPLFDMNGRQNRRSPTRSGPNTMRYVSSAGGVSARNAK